jgi:hypothetical protein
VIEGMGLMEGHHLTDSPVEKSVDRSPPVQDPAPLVTSDYSPTEGGDYQVPVVAKNSSDYLASNMPVVTGDYKGSVVTEKSGDYSPSVVTGDYSSTKSADTKTYRKPKRRPPKPQIPGCEVRNHEAGWNVFRVWYDRKKPGEKWPKKHRAYECYLTQSDVEKGLNYVTKKKS